MRRLGSSVLLISVLFAVPSFGTVIFASGAGSLPGTAEDITGLYPTEIVGSLDGIDQNDVNMFKFDILAPLQFSAITVDAGPTGIPDTVLSLFNSSGVGVYLNDDISFSNTLSCLPAEDPTTNPCPLTSTLGPLSPGVYYLAISRSSNYPLDGSSNEIFNPVLSTDVVGPSSTMPVAAWDGGAFTSPDFDLVNYNILLTGTTPEPGTLLLCGGAVLGLLFFRHRRAG